MCDCPVCGDKGSESGADHFMFIPFANPLDGGPPIYPAPHNVWTRTGDTFETISLTPSIQRQDECRWHGFITNGEIVTV